MKLHGHLQFLLDRATKPDFARQSRAAAVARVLTNGDDILSPGYKEP